MEEKFINDLEKGLKSISNDLRSNDKLISSKDLAVILENYTNEIIRTLRISNKIDWLNARLFIGLFFWNF